MSSVEIGANLKGDPPIPAPNDQEEWENRFHRKIDSKINKYLNCGHENRWGR